MDAFLPSEIGRLIYGYLFQQCGEGLADEFLNTCDSMRECRLLKQKYAKNFHHKVQDLSLEDILNRYSVMCSLIFKQASAEEPIHRNVLGLLKKVLSSKLLGLSRSSADCSHVTKPTGNGVSVGNEAETIITVPPVVQLQHPTNPANDEVDNSVNDVTGAAKAGVSIAELEPRANPTDEDDEASFSSGVSDAGGCHIDADDNDSPSGDILEEDSLSNVAKESAPVAASNECPQKNISPNTESRICAILCNSASLEERARQPARTDNLPFPAQYCTPLKQKVVSVPSVPTPLGTVASSVVDAPIENVSKSLSFVAKNAEIPASGKHSRRKLGDKVAKREKVLQPGTSGTLCKTMAKSSSVALASTSIADSKSAVVLTSTAQVNDQLIPATPNMSDDEVSPSTVPVSLSRAPMLTTTSVYQESRVSAIASPVSDVQEVSIVTPTSAIIPEATTENIFGELSFESECSLQSKLDKSSSSVKLVSEVDKSRQSPIKRSLLNADGSPIDSVMSIKSSATTAPTQNSSARNSETTEQTLRQSVADAEVIADSDELALAGSENKDIPWDLKLRLFLDNKTSMDAHITKRKPKDQRSRKLKEGSKKRKHNDGLDEPLSSAKRTKYEAVAAVPVVVMTPSQQPLVSKFVDADKSVDLASSSLRRRRGGAKEVDSTHEPVKNRRGKGAQERRTTPEPANQVKIGEESKKTPIAANAIKSLSSMNDIINFDSPVAEKKKAERLERAAAAEKKKQQVANAKKASSKEIREVAEARSSIKRAVDEKTVHSTGTAKGRKRSERIEERVAAQKKAKDDVDPKHNLPQVKEKPPPSPRKTIKSHGKDALSEANVKVSEKAKEIPEGYHQSMVVAVRETIIDDSVLNDGEPEFEIVLEISPEFELFDRSPRDKDN